ncbi:hypothetical protein WR25_14961 [Diploscapter pachys]|uniref:RRM domain-containing protein n=1 Tax=Diploscapter pachys TaxID=2018661 RepID=A0A2A2LS10_9BILA|nr:hypothetical protein WR25_14961 [Diploscapter pachys]
MGWTIEIALSEVSSAIDLATSQGFFNRETQLTAPSSDDMNEASHSIRPCIVRFEPVPQLKLGQFSKNWKGNMNLISTRVENLKNSMNQKKGSIINSITHLHALQSRPFCFPFLEDLGHAAADETVLQQDFLVSAQYRDVVLVLLKLTNRNVDFLNGNVAAFGLLQESTEVCFEAATQTAGTGRVEHEVEWGRAGRGRSGAVAQQTRQGLAATRRWVRKEADSEATRLRAAISVAETEAGLLVDSEAEATCPDAAEEGGLRAAVAGETASSALEEEADTSVPEAGASVPEAGTSAPEAAREEGSIEEDSELSNFRGGRVMNRGRGGFGSDRGRGGRGFSGGNRGNGFTPRGRGNFQNRDKFQSERKPRKFGDEDDDEMEEDEVPKKGGKSKSLPNTPLAGKGGPKNELNGNEEDESDSDEELDVNDEDMEEESEGDEGESEDSDEQEDEEDNEPEMKTPGKVQLKSALKSAESKAVNSTKKVDVSKAATPVNANAKTPATPHPSKDAKAKGKTPEAAKSAAKPQLNFESDEDEDDEEESGEDEEMDEEESGEDEEEELEDESGEEGDDSDENEEEEEVKPAQKKATAAAVSGKEKDKKQQAVAATPKAKAAQEVGKENISVKKTDLNAGVKRKMNEEPSTAGKKIKLDEKAIQVEEKQRHQETENTTLFLKGILRSAKDSELMALEPGIVSLRRRGRNVFAYLIFSSSAACDKAYANLSRKLTGKTKDASLMKLFHSNLVIDYVGSKSKFKGGSERFDSRNKDPIHPLELVVTSLTKETTQADMTKTFPAATEIRLKPAKNMAILHFGSEEETKKAFDKSRNLKINNRPVAVYYSRIRANAANDKKDKTVATDKAKQAQSAQKEKSQAQSKQSPAAKLQKGLKKGEPSDESEEDEEMDSDEIESSGEEIEEVPEIKPKVKAGNLKTMKMEVGAGDEESGEEESDDEEEEDDGDEDDEDEEEEESD